MKRLEKLTIVVRAQRGQHLPTQKMLREMNHRCRMGYSEPYLEQVRVDGPISNQLLKIPCRKGCYICLMVQECLQGARRIADGKQGPLKSARKQAQGCSPEP